MTEIIENYIKWLKWKALCEKCGMNPVTCEMDGE